MSKYHYQQVSLSYLIAANQTRHTIRRVGCNQCRLNGI